MVELGMFRKAVDTLNEQKIIYAVSKLFKFRTPIAIGEAYHKY